MILPKSRAACCSGNAPGRDNRLFPTEWPDCRVEEPRLGDLTVTSSAYGAPIDYGEGPAEAVLHFWTDGKLIDDKTGLAADITRSCVRFRFHPGSETQLPHPLIGAHLGDGRLLRRGRERRCFALPEPLAPAGARPGHRAQRRRRT